MNIFSGNSQKPKQDPDVIVATNHYVDGKPVPYNQRKTLAELQVSQKNESGTCHVNPQVADGL